jgi:hypothetical protein
LGDILCNDTDVALDTTTGIFTAKITGVYEFTARMLLNQSAYSAAFRYTHFTTGALTQALSYPKNLNTGYVTHIITLVIPMQVGQYLYPTVEGAGSVLIHSQTWSSFSGIFIKALFKKPSVIVYELFIIV